MLAYNPWNLLRAAPGEPPDDWDPAGVREMYKDQGDLVYRVEVYDAADNNRSFARFPRPRVSLTTRADREPVTLDAVGDAHPCQGPDDHLVGRFGSGHAERDNRGVGHGDECQPDPGGRVGTGACHRAQRILRHDVGQGGTGVYRTSGDHCKAEAERAVRRRHPAELPAGS